MVAAQFHHHLAPALAAFPEQVRGAALDSLAHALAAADADGSAGRAAGGRGNNAFLEAMDTSLIVLSCALIVAAAFIAIWSPGRDGRQLKLVRRVIGHDSADLTGDELGGAMAEHHDGGVRAAAGDRRQDRTVDYP